jgi:pyrroline-5-carboxylate reductase
MKSIKIAILGGGNIGTSLAKGLISSGHYTVDDIILTGQARIMNRFSSKERIPCNRR